MDPLQMFLHRRNAAERDTPESRAEDAGAAAGSDGEHRHPSMRGLDIPPVHGRHCICDRCCQQRAA